MAEGPGCQQNVAKPDQSQIKAHRDTCKWYFAKQFTTGSKVAQFRDLAVTLAANLQTS